MTALFPNGCCCSLWHTVLHLLLLIVIKNHSNVNEICAVIEAASFPLYNSSSPAGIERSFVEHCPRVAERVHNTWIQAQYQKVPCGAHLHCLQAIEKGKGCLNQKAILTFNNWTSIHIWKSVNLSVWCCSSVWKIQEPTVPVLLCDDMKTVPLWFSKPSFLCFICNLVMWNFYVFVAMDFFYGYWLHLSLITQRRRGAHPLWKINATCGTSKSQMWIQQPTHFYLLWSLLPLPVF